MKSLLIAAALATAALAGAAPSAASAQVEARQENQADRINQGVRQGDLTRPEVRRLGMQQYRINRMKQRMRARNGGYLTRRQRHRLAMRQQRASRAIYRARHNARRHAYHRHHRMRR